MISNSAKDFAEQYIRPHIMKWDESQYFPREILEKAGEMGFMGIFIPEEYGGSGLGYHEYVSIIEEISKVDPSIGLSIAAHNSLCTGHIFYFGNEEQKRSRLVNCGKIFLKLFFYFWCKDNNTNHVRHHHCKNHSIRKINYRS